MTTACVINEKALDQLFSPDRKSKNYLKRGRPVAGSFPLVDISESGDSYLLRAELPGFDKENLEVIYDDRLLILRGKRNANGEVLVQRERFYGEFERQFKLHVHLDPSKFNARYRDGILTVSIPKNEKSRLREIKVN